MLHPPDLPEDVLDRIAGEIGPRLAALLPEEDRGLRAELGEGFPCWALDERTLATDGSLGASARDLGIWHHQLLLDGRPAAFARSYVRPPEPLHVEVAAVGLSDVAKEIAAAAEWARANVSGDFGARLLLIPSRHVAVLWLVSKEEEVVVVARKPQAAVGLETERAYAAGDFAARLGR
ncbi:MAG: hypothetical protein M3273_07020 [Actinomycetota bacterium]|nr:hypothetical protein [Actinomycetota bacterium]